MNVSHFYRVALNSQCTIYNTSLNEAISIASFEDGLSPVCYRAVFHTFAQVVENTSTGECLLVRDHLGLHLLYYRYHSVQLIFGDTIPDILHQLSSASTFFDSEFVHLFQDVHYFIDNALYTGIKRVESRHMVHIFPDGRIIRSVFWQLEQEGDTLYYRDEREHLEDFESLIKKSVKNATQGSQFFAAEFSAGMDSMGVYGACAQFRLNPALFMHAAHLDSTNVKTNNDWHERAFIAQFPSATNHRLIANDFDSICIFKEYVSWSGGPSTYLFELFAHNLHRAVSKQGHTILLLGFGGDQGISSHIPARFILPYLINNKQFQQAWTESRPENPLRRFTQLIQCILPSFHKLIQHAQNLKLNLSNALGQQTNNEQQALSPTIGIILKHYAFMLNEDINLTH